MASKVELYEGLFLMSQQTGGDLAGSIRFVTEVLERAGAEILTVQKWDDRRLAYPIHGQKRGTYILALFRVNGVQIANIERDCNLSEEVVRVLVIRGEHLGDVEVQEILKDAETSQTETRLREARAEPAQETGDSGDLAEAESEAEAETTA